MRCTVHLKKENRSKSRLMVAVRDYRRERQKPDARSGWLMPSCEVLPVVLGILPLDCRRIVEHFREWFWYFYGDCLENKICVCVFFFFFFLKVKCLPRHESHDYLFLNAGVLEPSCMITDYFIYWFLELLCS
jgi:hypothetical protein